MAKVIGYDKSILTQYKKTCKKCGAIIVFKEDDVESEYNGPENKQRPSGSLQQRPVHLRRCGDRQLPDRGRLLQ